MRQTHAYAAITLSAALAAACCVSACSGETASTASGTTVSTGTTVSSGASPASASGSATGTAANGLSTPGAALVNWIHQVAAGNRSAYCQDTREQGLTAQQSSAACMSATGKATFNDLHGNFAIDGIKPSTPISVSAAHVTGTNATVAGRDIHLSGTTLKSIMAAHSTGLKPGQLTIQFQLSRVDGAWYVTGVNMNV
jgi:hypothetical protein